MYHTDPRKGKHLTYEERIQIEVLYRRGEPAVRIAALPGCAKRTIRQELKCGWADLSHGEYSVEERCNAANAPWLRDTALSTVRRRLNPGRVQSLGDRNVDHYLSTKTIEF